MHEASIALSLLSLVEQYCAKDNYNAVNSLKVRVGKLSSVMPDALLFAFDAIKSGTTAANAHLIIEEVNGGGMCNGCKGDFAFNTPYILECPLCGSSNFVITNGKELELIEMEVDI